MVKGCSKTIRSLALQTRLTANAGKKSRISSSSGSAAVSALIAMTIALGLMYLAPPLADKTPQAITHRAIVACFALLSLFSLAAAIHTRLAYGDPRRAVKSKAALLRQTAQDVRDRVWYYRTVSQHRQGNLSVQHLQRIARLEAMVNALDELIKEVAEHLKKNSEEALVAAGDTLSRKLVLNPDFMGELIVSEIPPEAPLDVWIARMTELSDTIEEELRQKRLLA